MRIRALSNDRGQALLISALIFLLLLIAIPVIIFVNRTSVHHSVAVQKKTKGQVIADEGLSFAIQRLSSSTVASFPSAATGDYSPGIKGSSPNQENARFVSQYVPLILAPGQSMPVSVSFLNNGQTQWDNAYQLISRNYLNNNTWGLQTVPINVVTPVAVNSTHTFTFNITAPNTPGDYQFQWGLYKPAGGINDFGQVSQNVTIRVQSIPWQPPYWPYISTGTLPAPITVTSALGGSFSITFTSATTSTPQLQNYQVGILSRPRDVSGNIIPASSLYARVSQRTVGVKVPSGYSASAALDLAYAPIVPNSSQLRVEMGPIVVRSTATWSAGSFMASAQRPRKFSAGGITERTTNPDAPSDQKEYWAYTPTGFSSVIDLREYANLARTSTCPAPACVGGGSCTALPVNSCYFPNVSPGTAVWDDTVSTPAGDRFVYVNGNAMFSGDGGTFVFHVGSGAFVVAGNLTLANNARPANTPGVTSVHVPPTIGLDDPYCTCNQPSCIGVVDRHIDFRGFLYVRGGLRLDKNIVTPNTLDNNWTINGVLRVDGQLDMDANTSLVVLYNDVINKKIRTTNFELQVDSLEYVP